MSNKFGFLSKLEFLQNLASVFVAGINSIIIHNLEKYYALKKVHYLSAIENIEGDYLEFGVFEGSSFCHSIRCCKNMIKIHPDVLKTRFFGFDSFSGFGKLNEDDKHPFYSDENFTTSLAKVTRRVKKISGKTIFRLISGFFEDSLRAGPAAIGINQARIVFIDSDTYSSANQALTFCITIVQDGTFIVLDDYFSYKGSMDKGIARAFSEFLKKSGFFARQVLSYGMGGVVFVISKSK